MVIFVIVANVTLGLCRLYYCHGFIFIYITKLNDILGVIIHVPSGVPMDDLRIVQWDFSLQDPPREPSDGREISPPCSSPPSAPPWLAHVTR